MRRNIPAGSLKKTEPSKSNSTTNWNLGTVFDELQQTLYSETKKKKTLQN